MTQNDVLAAIVAAFAERSGVVAVALGGSHGTGSIDRNSDYDLYVYASDEPDLTWRGELARRFGERVEVGNTFWEPGDEWILKAGAGTVDIMYRTPAWIEGMLSRVLDAHEASTGYSTCFWFNVAHSTPLWDPRGWYAALQSSARRPYPEALVRAIVAKNRPILRSTISSYRHQIEVAADRGDVNAVLHRVTAFLASYFDIVFAVNRVPHPGEKKLVAQVKRFCKDVPLHFEDDLSETLCRVSTDSAGLMRSLDSLADELDSLLSSRGLISRS